MNEVREKTLNKEAELALHVVKHLEKLKFDIYKEVSKRGGGSDRADIYAVSLENGSTIAIEVKLTFGIKVIEQCYAWKKFANFTYVAVPVGKRKDRQFAYFLCKTLGIGVIEIEPKKGFANIIVKSEYNKQITKPRLFEEQKFSIAGNNKHEYITPFKLTVSKLYEYLKTNGDTTISIAVSNIDHHYKSHMSACTSIIKYIENGDLPMFQLYSQGRKRFITIKQMK